MISYEIQIGSETIINTSSSTSYKVDNTTYQIRMVNIEYQKEVFIPCHIHAELSVSGFNIKTAAQTVASVKSQIDGIKKSLIGKKVDFKVKTLSNADGKDDPSNTAKIIGTNYYIHHIKPILQKIERAYACTLELEIMSRDHLLTLDKFSRTYLGQKLGGEIIANSLKYSNNTNANNNSASNTGGFLKAVKVDFDNRTTNLQHIYKSTTSGSTTTKVELKQPYLVQYNESFYDFIRRIAARCGEFLFYENGKLTLGTGGGATLTLEDENILSVEYAEEESSSVNVTSHFYNYMSRKLNDKTPYTLDTNISYNEDNADDDYFVEFSQESNDLPDNFDNESWKGIIVKHFLKNAGRINTNYLAGSLTEFFTAFLLDIGTDIGALTAQIAYANSDYKKNIFTNAKENSKSYIEGEQKSGNKLYQHATYPNEIETTTLKSEQKTTLTFNKIFSTYYTYTRNCEVAAKNQAIKVNITGGIQEAKVGDILKIYNDASTCYIIYKVSGAFKQQDGRFEEIQTIEAVPYINDFAYPPYNPCAEPRMASAQSAFVVENNDPKRQQRIRIKYPWENDASNAKSTASPWIRMLTPMASTDCGMFFNPSIGDEVMIDYIGGNIERPYVSGLLFNPSEKFQLSYYKPDSYMIRGKSMQFIRFGTGKNTAKPLTDLVPGLDTILKFAPLAATQAISSKIDNLTGGSLPRGSIELADVYGFWTIKGDSADRSITIDSLIGKVTISALTGITISAPFGNIKLEGKNIDILASNNVNIQSGLSIKSEIDKKNDKKYKDKSTKEQIGIGIAEAAATTANKLIMDSVDLSIIRTIVEIFVSPKAGTLKLKSHRYIQMEAGEGTAIDNETGFMSLDIDKARKNKEQKLAQENATKDLEQIRSKISAICYEIHMTRDSIFANSKKLSENIDGYKNQHQEKQDWKLSATEDALKQFLAKNDNDNDTYINNIHKELSELHIEKAEAVRKNLKVINKLVQSLKKTKETIENSGGPDNKSTQTIIKEVMTEYIKTYVDSNNANKLTEQNNAAPNTITRKYIRQGLFRYLKRNDDILKINMQAIPKETEDLSNEKWTQIIDAIEFVEVADTASGLDIVKNDLLKNVRNPFSKSFWKETEPFVIGGNQASDEEKEAAWSTSRGKILMSQNNETTYELKNGTIEEKKNIIRTAPNKLKAFLKSY